MHRVLALDLGAGSGSLVASLLMGAGIVIIAFVAYVRLRSGRSEGTPRTPKPTPAPREHLDRERAVMNEMQELTRACVAQIESRIARLEATIREADDRLARLNGLESHRIEPKPAPVVETRRITPSRPAVGGDELSQRVFALADAGRTPGDIARELSEHTGKVELILALRQETRRAGAV